MPCYYDDGPSERVVYRPSPYDTPEFKRSLDIVTRLACDHCKSLEVRGEPVPAWAAQWWDEHKRADEVREAREAAEEKRRALLAGIVAKLTKEELNALSRGGI